MSQGLIGASLVFFSFSFFFGGSLAGAATFFAGGCFCFFAGGYFCAGLLSLLEPQTGTKGPCPPPLPAGPASRWTRDKSHLLSQAQRLPGQMAWNKGLFCSSVRIF